MNALRRHFFAKELIRNLNQNPGTIPHQSIRTDRATMIEVDQNLQALLNNAVTAPAFDIGDKAHAASVMLLIARIEAALLRFVASLALRRCVTRANRRRICTNG